MRDKIFGTHVGTPLSRAAKRRVLAHARHWNARHKQPGQHIGPLTRATFDVLRALLFSFHNQHTGRCFPPGWFSGDPYLRLCEAPSRIGRQ